MYQIIRKWREPYEQFYKVETVATYETFDEAKEALHNKYSKMLAEDPEHAKSYVKQAWGAGFNAYYCQEFFIVKAE